MADTYPANCGEIATPATDKIVDTLSHKTGGSLPVRHNAQSDIGSTFGAGIEGPATDSIVKGLDKVKSYE